MKSLPITIAISTMMTLSACQNSNNATTNNVAANTSNTTSTETSNNVNNQNISSRYPTSFFSFDEVVWYNTTLPDTAIMNMSDAPTDAQKTTLQLLRKKDGIQLTDTALINNLEKYNYTKSIIPKEKHQVLEEIFRQKEHHHIDQANCMTMYRDILIFKHQGKITGTAKICMTCAESVIMGSKTDASLFGQSGDFKKLEKVLTK